MARQPGESLRGRWRALLASAAISACALACAAGAASASAATLSVNSTADEALASEGSTVCETAAHSCTLRAAVQAADNAAGESTITLPAGEYKLSIAATSTEDPANGDLDITGSAKVTLTGAGSGTTTINANYIDRAFAVQEGAGLSLSGVTIEHGNPSTSSSGFEDGGAIYSDGALAVTGDVVFENNASLSGEHGGAIYADSGANSSLSVSGGTFLRNNAYYGGAIYLDQPGTASISKSSFDEDNANGDYGGALYGAGKGGLKIESSSFTGNDAEYGGGIYWESETPVSATNSTFTGNSGGYYVGGAIYDEGSTEMTLSSDRFTGNSGGYGGALYLESKASTTPKYVLEGDEFNGNIANEGGGAISWYKGTLSVSGSSFIDNNGGDEGGAMEIDSGLALSLVNSTISENTAGYGGGLVFYTNTPTTMTNDTIAFNSAGGTNGGGVDGASYAAIGTEGATGVVNTIVAENAGGDCYEPFSAADAGYNLDSDGSCFAAATDKVGVNPLLAKPAENGGSVLTDRLMTGSPAINGGTNAGCPATDARGVTRPQGSACDIGAYEVAAAGLSLTDSAPSSVGAGMPLTYTLTVTDAGPGPSTGTTVTGQLPAGGALFGATPSQGSCTSAGSPAKVTCALGTIEAGKSATVSVLATLSTPGTAVSTATAGNDEGGSAGASATTQVTPLVSGIAVGASTGAASRISKHAATLSGSLAGVSSSTAYFFQYGKSKSYGLASAVKSTSSSGAVSAGISHLNAGTTYHYRLVAINGGGASYGADRTFRTKGVAAARLCRVPKVHRLTLKRAKKALRAAGCHIGKLIRRHNLKTKRGRVVLSNPHHGTILRGKRKVQLVLSLGKRHK